MSGGAFTAVTLPAADSAVVTHFLTPGSVHRYRLRATDGRGTQSDAVLGPSATLDARNETYVSIAYTGTWSTQSLTKFFGGGVKFAVPSTAKATLTLTGTSVSWVTTCGPGRGKAEVWLDGARLATIDLYAPTFRVRQIMFARNGLANAAHTLEIRVPGTHNAASTGNRVDVDAFVVLR